jgi:integrase/recombinase XerD
MNKITIKPILHNGKNVILISFAPNPEWNKRVKAFPGSKWSNTHKGWLIPDTADNRNKCKLPPATKQLIPPNGQQVVLQKSTQPKFLPYTLSTGNAAALKEFILQLQLKKYSPSTIKTYTNEFSQLLQKLGTYPVEQLSSEQMKRYMHACVKQGLSENTLHSRLNALKFYYEQILKREKFFWEIPRPKKQMLLPKVFNQDDITAIIKAAGNIKHKAMLMLAYAAGLRISEVVAIKVQDIDSRRMSILISQAKGKKDRLVRLSPVLLVMLREYWKKERPLKNGYLFAGQNKGEPYSTRSLQLVLASAKQKAGVLKPGSIHTLRHSFATHLLDKGTDVTMIQKLLGHNDIKTTLRYLHVTNRDILQVISPLDDLKL